MGGGPADLRESCGLAGMLFEMVGDENGRVKAEEMIDSGKAEAKDAGNHCRPRAETQRLNPKTCGWAPNSAEVRSEKSWQGNLAKYRGHRTGCKRSGRAERKGGRVDFARETRGNCAQRQRVV